MKLLQITTASNGIIRAIVASSRDAVNLLQVLASEGIKCIRWEMKA